jgi:hypothetical protein
VPGGRDAQHEVVGDQGTQATGTSLEIGLVDATSGIRLSFRIVVRGSVDTAIAAVPVGFAKNFLADLARRRVRQANGRIGVSA